MELELVQGVAKNGCRKTKVGCGVVVVASSIGLAHSLYMYMYPPNRQTDLTMGGECRWEHLGA